MKMHNILLGVTLMFTAAASIAAETYKEAWANGYNEYKAKKYKEALAAFGEAVKLAKTPAEKYNSMMYQGYSLRYLRKYTDAIKVYEDLLKVDKLSESQKNNAFSQYLHNFYYSKNYKELFSIVEKNFADEKASKGVKTTCAYLACLASSNKRKYDDKIKWAKKLQELNPSGTWYNRGLIYQAQGLRSLKKYKEAEAVLSKEAISKMPLSRQGEASLELGHIKSYAKKYDEAVVEYTAVYENPKANSYHKGLAIVYVIEKLNSAGKPDEAAVWIEKVDTIKNKYWKARGFLRAAQLLQKQGKLKEAKTKWEQCLKTGKWFKKDADKQIALINKKLNAK
jgi:tetratricopeptide (TPR) repeat protein